MIVGKARNETGRVEHQAHVGVECLLCLLKDTCCRTIIGFVVVVASLLLFHSLGQDIRKPKQETSHDAIDGNGTRTAQCLQELLTYHFVCLFVS